MASLGSAGALSLSYALVSLALPSRDLSQASEAGIWLCSILLLLVAGHSVYVGIKRGFPYLGIVTALTAALTLIAVAIPGAELRNGSRTSVLTELGVTAFAPYSKADSVYLLFIACMGAMALGEVASAATRASRVILPARKGHSTRPPTLWAGRLLRRATHSPQVLVILMGIGVLGLFLSPGHGHSAAAFQSRGQVHGAGVTTLMMQCAPSALAIGVLRHHFGSKFLGCANSLLLVVFFLESTSRSPLIFVAVAVGVRLLGRASRNRMLSLRAVFAGAALLYGLAVFVVSFDQYRGAASTGQPTTLAHEVTKSASDPFGSLAAKGNLDTFDGAVLALNANRSLVHATVFDPLKALSEFVPYQLWHSKPNLLGAVVTESYTNIGGLAGIFLSGPGYCYLVFGGFGGATIAFGCLGFLLGRMLNRYQQDGFAVSLLLYFVVRFVTGGDAFDATYVLEQLLGVLIAGGIWMVIRRASNSSVEVGRARDASLAR